MAWNEAEQAKLPAIAEQARINGVTDADLIEARSCAAGSRTWGRRRAPPSSFPAGASWIPVAVAGLCAAGYRPGRRGAPRHRSRRVADLANGAWTLRTNNGPVQARLVINASGDYGDLVEAIARPSPFAVKPRKGQFVVFDKPASRLITSSILPVPTERTKGVMMCRTIFGNLIVGPTAEDEDDRADASVTQEMLRHLIEQGRRRVPTLADQTVTAVYAGLRPATQFEDYQVGRCRTATGSPPAASVHRTHGRPWHRPACRRTLQQALRCIARPPPRSIHLPNLAEHLPRPISGRARGNRLSLRAGHAPRDRRSAAGRPYPPAISADSAPHALHDGPLPGLLLQRAGVRAGAGRITGHSRQRGCRMTMHDVVIIGGGPAGLSAARRLLASASRRRRARARQSRPRHFPPLRPWRLRHRSISQSAYERPGLCARLVELAKGAESAHRQP